MKYYFDLPAYGDLNTNQRFAVDEDNAVALSGGPGTGKTVVSLWRHIRNHNVFDIDSLLLTYTKTLEHYLKGTARTKSSDAANNISRTLKWSNSPDGNHYDEIIIDEAQDIELSVYNNIKSFTNKVSFGADDAQQVYNGCKYDDLIEKFYSNEEYELEINYRNSREIIEFTKAVFPNIFIDPNVLRSAEYTGIKPKLIELGFRDFDENVVESIASITKQFPQPTHNIGILAISAKEVIKYHKLLSRILKCSMYHSGMHSFKTLERIHISTFKSAKGLEFDTVIIPNFDSYNHFIEDSRYKGQFSENDYYVGLTRAKKNLYLLCKFKFKMSSYETIEIR